MHRFILSAPLLALLSTTSQAAIVQHDFWLLDGNGDLLTNDGILGYDDDALLGQGSEYLSPAEGVFLTFTLNGRTFTEENDYSYDALPTISFFDGVLEYLDYYSEDGVNGADFTGFGYYELWTESLVFSPDANAFLIETRVGIPVVVGSVPLPAGLPLAAAGLGALALLRRKKAKTISPV